MRREVVPEARESTNLTNFRLGTSLGPAPLYGTVHPHNQAKVGFFQNMKIRIFSVGEMGHSLYVFSPEMRFIDIILQELLANRLGIASGGPFGGPRVDESQHFPE